MRIFKPVIVLLLICFATEIYTKTHEVLVSSNVFSPRDIVIEAGDTIRWINTGGPHNVYEVNGRFRCAQGCEANGGNGNPSTELWQSEVTFHSVETVNYICQPHISFGMQGSVTVVAPSNKNKVFATLSNDFNPQDITIIQGDKVNFINQAGNHNIHLIGETAVCSIGCSGDGSNLTNSPTGFAWDIFLEFNQEGEYPYFCEAHEKTGNPGIIRVIPELIFLNGFELQ